MIPKNDFSKPDELGDFILQWNIDFPIDRWWRKTYKVSFNSSIHREMSFIDMTLDFLENSLYDEFIEKSRSKEQMLKDQGEYIPGEKNFLFVREFSQELSDEEFFNLDIE